MHSPQPSLIARSDTFLGICEALGQDLGVNANWLRLGFGVLLLVSPLVMAAAYLGTGLLVLLSRTLFPAGKVTAEVQVMKVPVAENEEAELALAA